MFPDELETERLELERLDRAVTPLELYEVCSAAEMEEVTRYMPWDPHETPKESAEFLAETEENWAEDRSATYAVVPREGEDGAGEFAGTCSLAADWDRRVGTLGLWLRKRFWGRGYSGERAGALFELAFETLDLDAVEVTHHADNEKSERAIEKYVERFGGRRESTLRAFHATPDGAAVDAVRYTVTHEEYEAAV